MKKVFSLLLVALLVLTMFSGCGKIESENIVTSRFPVLLCHQFSDTNKLSYSSILILHKVNTDPTRASPS